MSRKYSIRDFRNSTPDWKRKKETIIGRILYRPISYVISSCLSNIGVRANTVSFFSIFVSVFGCALFFLNSICFFVMGSLLFILWAVLDCVDGDMARTIGKQPFGEFADALSCYVLQSFMSVATGYAVYTHGGLLFEKNSIFIILIGCGASIANLLMRLVYQKYLQNENDLVAKGIIQKEVDVWKDKASVSDFRVRFKEAMGVGGWLPIFTLTATLLNALDIITIYCFIMYGGASILTISSYIKKAYKIGNQCYI